MIAMKLSKKKGMSMTSALGSIILLLVALVVIFGFGPKIYGVAKIFFGSTGLESGDGQKTTLSADPGTAKFEEFVSLYKKCKSYSSDKCMCDSFDYTALPEGYTIKLENLQTTKKTRMELRSDKPTPEKVETIDNDALCFYNFVGDKFEKITAQDMDLSKNNYKDYKAENKIQLFKFDNGNTCFVQATGREAFQALNTREARCELKAKGEADLMFTMLDLGESSVIGTFNGEVNSAKLLEELEKNLLYIMKVSRITQEFASVTKRFERRTAWFQDKYKRFDRNGDQLLSDDIVLISVRGLYRNIGDSEIKQDYFKIHYLKDSAGSKALAENIAKKLEEINRKFILDGRDYKEGEVDRRYKINAKVVIEENDVNNPGPVFLACAGDYKDFAACKENTKMPAVFIDVVEVQGDGSYMFTGHYIIFSQKIYEGVRNYLASK